MLVGRERSGVDVDVGIDLDGRHADVAVLEDRAERAGDDALADAADHAPGYQNVLHCRGKNVPPREGERTKRFVRERTRDDPRASVVRSELSGTARTEPCGTAGSIPEADRMEHAFGCGSSISKRSSRSLSKGRKSGTFQSAKIAAYDISELYLHTVIFSALKVG